MAAMMMILAVILGGLSVLVLYLYDSLVLKPKRLISKLEKQGIRGPPPSSVLVGNIPEIKSIKLRALKSTSSVIDHDWPSTIFPHLLKWRNEYGPIFVYSTGAIQFLSVTDVDIVKEVSLCTSLNLGKPAYLSKDHKPLLGQGVLASNGAIWSHQRKIIAPEFYADKVKGMVKLMVDSTTSMLRSWESKIESGVAVFRVDEDLRSLSADIISRSSFGSNYSEGKEIFIKLRTLQKVMSQRGIIGVPGVRHLPTKVNREIRRLEKEIHSMIVRVAKERSSEATHEKDLLQMILEGATNYGDADTLFSAGISQENFIVDNCKNIYFAGHETTAITASWSLMLLAANPEWQARARDEVLGICADGIPDADMLRSMKTLNMVIQETLRLYPPAVSVIRQALEDIKLKNIVVPKGMNIQIPIPILQRLPDLWGPDALDFNPKRFENGVLGACNFPQAYIPFGVGARICLGQHLAMTELKLNMVIQETLRLYPPAVIVVRQAIEDIELNSLLLPKGTNIQIPVPILHQLPEIWRPDALDFHPKRFEHGILKACKFPHSYMPFGFGPRVCLGQHLAMTELKVILSLILSKFSFTLSPEYKHCPAFRLVIEPEHGVSLLLRRA